MSICWLVCQQNYTNTTVQISVKLGRRRRMDLAQDDEGLDKGFRIFFLIY